MNGNVNPTGQDAKNKQLGQHREINTGSGKIMTSDSGYKIPNNRWTLRAGKRGPVLIRDTDFYRKQSRFNRERIPEKVVHARGFGLYGEFELYKSMKEYTVADFLQKPGTKPLFLLDFLILSAARVLKIQQWTFAVLLLNSIRKKGIMMLPSLHSYFYTGGSYEVYGYGTCGKAQSDYRCTASYCST